jgi:general stress protein YciG
MAKKRGFGSMDPERQRKIASMGGKTAHKRGTAHQWTSEEAREAGRKGGKASRAGFRKMDPEKQKAIASMGGKKAHKLGRAHEFTSDEAKIAGAKGGRSKKNKK